MKREGSYPFWLHRVRPRTGLVRASRRAIHLTNRPKHNGPVYARGSSNNLGQDIRSLCTSSNTSVGSQGAATRSFRAAHGIRANGKSNIWVGPMAGPSRLARGLARRQVALERRNLLFKPQDPFIETLQRRRLSGLDHPV